MTTTGTPRVDPRLGTGRPDRYAGSSVGELISGLLDEGRGLVRDEIQLARTEATEKLSALGKDLVPIGVAAGLGLGAFLMLITFLDLGLTALLAQAVDREVAAWLAPLLLAAAFGIAAMVFLDRGRKALRRETLSLTTTKTTLQEDARWIKGRVS